MFREMVRKNKQLPRDECIELLKSETRGVLSVIGDEGYPYGSPLNHFYNEDDGCIYFHCGRQQSHRLDSLRQNDKVSFCLFDKGVRKDGDWVYIVKSVIIFGRMEIIDNKEIMIDITTKLSRKFTLDEEYIRKEIEDHGHRTLLLKLTPEHICGKLVTES